MRPPQYVNMVAQRCTGNMSDQPHCQSLADPRTAAKQPRERVYLAGLGLANAAYTPRPKKDAADTYLP
jgi:hypothetical protein